MHYSHRIRGFTLIELLVGVSILAVVLSIAVPSFSQMIRRNRLATQVNEYVTAMNYARSEAYKRGLPISLCASNSAQTSCASASDWDNGWLVLVDADADGTLDSGTDVILQTFRPPASGFNFTPNPSQGFVTFRTVGASTFSMTISKSGCTGPERRVVDVAPTGRISLTKENC